MIEWATVGAVIGGIAAAAGVIGNWVGSAVSNVQGVDKEKKQAENNYKSSLYQANEALRTAEGYYNQTMNKVSNNYGVGVAKLLEQQYNDVNKITKNSVAKGGAVNLYDTDTLKNVTADFDYNFEKHDLSSSDITENTVDSIYNLLTVGDTALAQELRTSGNQIGLMLKQAQDQVNESFELYKDQFSQYNEQHRAQRISDTESIANARASMAYSGIRNTGTGSASENLARLQADLTEATMAFQIKSQATQLRQKINEIQTSASLSAYQSRASIELAKKQALEEATSVWSSGMYDAERYQNTARTEVENAQEFKNQYDDYGKVSWWDALWGNY